MHMGLKVIQDDSCFNFRWNFASLHYVHTKNSYGLYPYLYVLCICIFVSLYLFKSMLILVSTSILTFGFAHTHIYIGIYSLDTILSINR